MISAGFFVKDEIGLLSCKEVDDAITHVLQKRQDKRNERARKKEEAGSHYDNNTTISRQDEDVTNKSTVKQSTVEESKEEYKTEEGTQTAENLSFSFGKDSPTANSTAKAYPLKAFIEKYERYRGVPFCGDKDNKDEKRMIIIARYCGSSEAYTRFLDWFFLQDSEFLRQKKWNTYAATIKFEHYVENWEREKAKHEEPVPW